MNELIAELDALTKRFDALAKDNDEAAAIAGLLHSVLATHLAGVARSFCMSTLPFMSGFKRLIDAAEAMQKMRRN